MSSEQQLWNQIVNKRPTEAAQIEQENTGKPFYEWQSVTPRQKAIDLMKNPVAVPVKPTAAAPAVKAPVKQEVQPKVTSLPPALRTQPKKEKVEAPAMPTKPLASEAVSGQKPTPVVSEPTEQMSTAPKDQSSPKGDDQFDWKELLSQVVIAGGPMMLDAMLGGKYMAQAARAGQQAHKGYLDVANEERKAQRDHAWDMEKRVAAQPKPIAGFDEETGKQAYGILNKDESGNTYFKNAATGSFMPKFIPQDQNREVSKRGTFQPKAVVNPKTGVTEWQAYDTATNSWTPTGKAVGYSPMTFKNPSTGEQMVAPRNVQGAVPQQITGIGAASTPKGAEISLEAAKALNSDAEYKVAQGAYTKAKTVEALLDLNNKVTYPTFMRQMSKLSGEVGALTAGDVQAFSGSQALVDRLQQLKQEIIDNRMTPDNVKQYKEMLDVMLAKHTEIINEKVNMYQRAFTPAARSAQDIGSMKEATGAFGVKPTQTKFEDDIDAELARRAALRGGR